MYESLVVANAFSLNMLLHSRKWNIMCEPLTRTEARRLVRKAIEVESIVGHADTAALFSNELGHKVEFNRVSFVRKPYQVILVGQYSGPRLPEGTSVLPEGASINWWLIRDPE